jgi:hypothetical protein
MTDTYSTVFRELDASVAGNRCLASSDAQIRRALARFQRSDQGRGATRQLAEIALQVQALSPTGFSRELQRRAVIERLRDSARVWLQRLPMQ